MPPQGQNLTERLAWIDNFFKELTIEEFEKMSMNAGLGTTIKESCESDYVKAMQPVSYEWNCFDHSWASAKEMYDMHQLSAERYQFPPDIRRWIKTNKISGVFKNV